MAKFAEIGTKTLYLVKAETFKEWLTLLKYRWDGKIIGYLLVRFDNGKFYKMNVVSPKDMREFKKIYAFKYKK